MCVIVCTIIPLYGQKEETARNKSQDFLEKELTRNN